MGVHKRQKRWCAAGQGGDVLFDRVLLKGCLVLDIGKERGMSGPFEGQLAQQGREGGHGEGWGRQGGWVDLGVGSRRIGRIKRQGEGPCEGCGAWMGFC